MKKDNINRFNENGINIKLKDRDLSNKDKTINTVSNIIIASFVYIVIILSLISLFNIEGISYIPLLIGFIIIIGFGYYFEQNEKLSIVSIIILLIVLAFIFIQKDYIKNGLFLIINQIADVIGSHTGYIIEQYEINIGQELFEKSIINFSIIFSTIIAYLSIISVRNNSNILLVLIIIPIYMFQAFTGVLANLIYNILLLLALMIIASNSFARASNDTKINIKRSNISLYVSVFFILFITISSLLIIFILPINNYSASPITEDLKYNITNKIEDYRYEKDKTNSFTQGDFTRIGELELSETEALEIKMDEPVSLYLKGYIGSKYTSKRWTDLDEKTYYDSYPLFYWLNESRFNGLSQLSEVNELTMNNTKNKDKTKIKVNNINGNSKYIYIPYEFDYSSAKLDNVRNLSDEKLVSKKLKGNREYSYISNKNLVTKYPGLVGNIYKMRDKVELKEYIENESYYNRFVYENYTQIPEEIEELIKGQIGTVNKNGDLHIPYEIAIKEVKTYLKENIKYVKNPKVVSKEVDFLTFLLEDSREGYSTHYATAGTAMFRYLGIPSRYVEGYLVTPKDVKNTKASEPIKIAGKNAHAWTEIYIDQLGWIPIELTPAYEDVMDPIDMSNYPGGGNVDKDIYINSKSKYEEGQQEIFDDEEVQSSRPKDKEKKKMITLRTVLILLGLLLLVLILIYVIYVIKNRKKLKRFKNGFKDSNYKRAVHRMFSYSMYLMHYAGMVERGGSIYSYVYDVENNYSDKYVEIFENAIGINQKALYSNHEISKEEHEYMIRFKNQILYDLVESKNVLQRIKMKLWDFIY